VIEFRDVHKHFGPLHVLRGINLTVNQRDVVVVIGPSGSGKSTMIRTINKLEPIDSGELVVDGLRVHDPHVDVNKLRRDVGMVFQSFNLFPHLTAAENVMLAPRSPGRWRWAPRSCCSTSPPAPWTRR
jgi:ABC-type polar amino acid transport system ATPase subunit